MESTRFSSRSATLEEIRPVARDTFVYRLVLDAPLPFRAGQFVNLAVPEAKPRPERSYSVYSSPEDPSVLELCIKLFEGGAASEYLRVRNEGDVVQIRGPFGVFTLREDEEPVVFVCTATGIAPFRSMLFDPARRADPRPFRMYFGVRSQEDLFGVEDLEVLRQTLPDFDYRICLSRPAPGWDGYVGRVTAALAEDFPAPTEHFYLCGNGAMIDETRELLKSRELDRRHIHVEKYY
jgi:NAD(P)H-flavin reductase